jgi:hypothetical protein
VQGLAAGKRQALAGHGIRSGEHRRPRGRGGTQPGRISQVRNVETPSGSGRSAPGKPTVRKAQFPGREQDDPTSQCRRPKGGRKPGQRGWLLRQRCRITGRIPGLVPLGPKGR